MASLLFISHHSGESSVARRVEEALLGRGVACWMAPRDVEPGEPFDEAIERAIARSTAVLLLVSERAAGSRHVKRELIIADNHHKTIIPLRLEPVEPARLTYHLADSQWIDWNDGDTHSLDRIAARVLQIAGQPVAVPAPAPASPPPAAPHPVPVPDLARPPSGSWRIAAAIAVAGLVGVGIGWGGATLLRSAPEAAGNRTVGNQAAATPLILTPDRSSVQEGETMTFIIARTDTSAPQTLMFSLVDRHDEPLRDGDAQIPGGGRPTDVPVQFQSGEAIQSVEIEVRDDQVRDDGSRFTAILREQAPGGQPGPIVQRSSVVQVWDRGAAPR